MKYLNEHEDQEILISKEIDFNKKGSQVLNKKEKIFAKIVPSKENENYFITTYKNQIYDPIGINSNREKYLETKLKRVSKETFDFF